MCTHLQSAASTAATPATTPAITPRPARLPPLPGAVVLVSELLALLEEPPAGEASGPLPALAGVPPAAVTLAAGPLPLPSGAATGRLSEATEGGKFGVPVSAYSAVALVVVTPAGRLSKGAQG